MQNSNGTSLLYLSGMALKGIKSILNKKLYNIIYRYIDSINCKYEASTGTYIKFILNK